MSDFSDLSKKRERLSEEQRRALALRFRKSPDTDSAAQGLTSRAEERYEPFPLTDLQEAYWVGRQEVFELSMGCHIYYEFEVHGIDVPRLRTAWRKVVARHEMLRTVFLPDGRQRVLEEIPDYEIEEIDLGGMDAGSAAARLEAVRGGMSHGYRPASRWPWFEVRVTRLPDGTARLHFTLDHLVCDGQSLHILVREIARCYDEPGTELPPLEVSYRDYQLHARSLEDSAEYHRSREYWLGRLDELADAPALPVERKPGAIGNPRFVRRDATLDEETWARLKERGARANLTPSGVLLAAYSEVLARWGKSQRFTLNLTLFNRLPLHPQVNDVVGDFTSITLLGVDAASPACFEDRARAIQERLWEDMEQSRFGGVRVLRELARARGQSQGAAMPVVFTSLINQEARTSGASQLRLPWKWVHGVSQTPQVWLDHVVVEYDGVLELHWDYPDGLFPDGVLDEMFVAYLTLLNALAEGEGAWTGPLPEILPPAQLEARRAEAAAGAPIPPRLLDELFVEQARVRPDAVAVVSGERSLAYGELEIHSRELAHTLRALGVERGALVAVALEKGWEQVVAVLGVLRAGGAYVPLDPGMPRERFLKILRDTGTNVVVTAARLAVDWPDGVRPVFLEAWGGAAAADLPALERNWDDLAYVIYTSGSTGDPKGAMIPHRGAVNTLLDVNHRLGIGVGDRALALSSLSFDLSVYDVFGTLAAGGTLVMPGPDELRDPESWLSWIRRERVTVWNSVPALMEMLVEYMEERGITQPGSLRAVMLSGDWIPVHLPDRVRAAFPAAQVHSLGGPTEASIWQVHFPVGEVDPAWPSIPYGRPLRNQHVYVLNERLEVCPELVTGEIYIGGDGVGIGYWGDEARTRERFITHPRSGERLYRSGDLGRYLRGGIVEILGREDHQVKIQGHRIELGEIEAALLRHPAVHGAVAAVIRGDRAPARLAAYVVPAEPGAVDAAQLRRFMEAHLPPYMVPAAFILLDRLPLTRNGKVDRNALAGLAELPAEPSGGHVPPRTEVERELASIWGGLLNVESAGVHDDFFRSGGNSILAMRFCTAVGRGMAREVSMRDFFEGPTIAHVAALIDGREADAANLVEPAFALPTIVPAPAERDVPFPLTDIQQAYWVGRKDGFELGNVSAHAYNEFDGDDLDLDRFERAWWRLVERHDLLRAYFLEDGRQRVLTSAPASRIAVEDLRGVSPEERERRLDAVRDAMSHQVIPSDRWPLWEVRVSILPEGRTRVHLSFDLLIGDAWSLVTLNREFGVLYRDPDACLPPLELAFRDYVLAESALEGSAMHARALAYWTMRAPTLPPAPQLPLATAPAAVDKPRFVRRAGELDQQRWRRLQRHAREAGVTPSVVLCSVFAEVLAYWSASPRFTLNLTLFNRYPMHPQVNEVVGDFTSLTLLEVDFVGEPSFTARARKLQQQLWADLDHRGVSGVRVLREIARIRGDARAALMPVVFTSTLGTGALAETEGAGVFDPGMSFADLPFRPAFGISQTPQVWLDHAVAEYEGALRFHWDAVDELFPEGMLDDMFDAYRARVEQLADGEAGWNTPAPALLPERQRATREAYNSTDGPLAAETLHGLFFAQAPLRGDAPAVVAHDATLSYQELAARARALAQRLQAAGVGPGDRVAIVMEKGWEQVVAVLGILQAGAAYVPLDPSLPPRRFTELLDGIGAGAAVTQPLLDARLAWPESVVRIAVDRAPVGAGADDPLPIVQGPEDLAYVIFTSGSTGVPKGVMIDHRGAVNTILDVNRSHAVGPDDRVLALSSLSFDLSVWDVFGTLAAGGAVVIPPPAAAKDPAAWRELMEGAGVTVWNSVPALMEMLVEWLDGGRRSAPPGLRLVMMSGDWIPVRLPDRIRVLWPEARVISMGGATEASIWSIHFPIGHVGADWTSIPYGQPMLNQHFYVLDDALEWRPDWVSGEMYIGGVGVALGYWGDEAKTRERFVVHPVTGERLYRTGDMGRFRPDGNIEIMGRLDLQVKVQGHRIELGEIEAALASCPGVSAAVVNAVRDARGHPTLVAYVVPAARGSRSGMAVDRFSPAQRLRFKAERRGVRRDLRRPHVDLGSPPVDDLAYLARRSYRRFSHERVPLEAISGMLSPLRSVAIEGYPLPKYRYASAGGTYPVQTYVLVRPHRVAGLNAGLYYHDPELHRLVPLHEPGTLPEQVYDASGLEGDPAFAVLLVARMAAIEPLYGELSRDFCKVEAGIMSHLLETSSVAHRIGLYQVGGGFDFDRLRALGSFDPDHVHVHSLVGGRITQQQTTREGFLDDNQDVTGFARVLEEEAPAAERPLAAADVQDFLRGELPDYMVPPVVVFIDAVPLSANGKVDRKALAAPASLQQERAAEFVAPRAGYEEVLAMVWKEVLSVETVGVHDSFFDLGGHSLRMIEVQNRLRERLGREISIVDLFTYPTVASLARHLEPVPATAAPDEAPREGADQIARSREERRRLRQAASDPS
jgi:amino acid adenylation domain-containing protein